MTGQESADCSDGIWDDGEQVSWDWINGHIHKQDLETRYPKADPAVSHIFERLVEVAADHKAVTGKYLQVWGELGELYAEVYYGMTRHRAHTQGSDVVSFGKAREGWRVSSGTVMLTYDRSFDPDAQPHRAASRAREHASCGAVPARSCQLQHSPA